MQRGSRAFRPAAMPIVPSIVDLDKRHCHGRHVQHAVDVLAVVRMHLVPSAWRSAALRSPLSTSAAVGGELIFKSLREREVQMLC